MVTKRLDTSIGRTLRKVDGSNPTPLPNTTHRRPALALKKRQENQLLGHKKKKKKPQLDFTNWMELFLQGEKQKGLCLFQRGPSLSRFRSLPWEKSWFFQFANQNFQEDSWRFWPQHPSFHVYRADFAQGPRLACNNGQWIPWTYVSLDNQLCVCYRRKSK